MKDMGLVRVVGMFEMLEMDKPCLPAGREANPTSTAGEHLQRFQGFTA